MRSDLLKSAGERALRAFRSALSEASNLLLSVRTDMVRDIHSAGSQIRSARALLFWCFAPEQLRLAITFIGRIVRALIMTAVLAFILGWPFLPLLYRAKWYEEHQWISVPEPFRTLYLAVVFSIAALWLYRLRWRERVLYGCIEIIAAIATFSFTVVERYPTDAPLSRERYILDGLQIAAALYIFVRGLDNIGQSLTPNSRLYRFWWDLILQREGRREDE